MTSSEECTGESRSKIVFMFKCVSVERVKKGTEKIDPRLA